MNIKYTPYLNFYENQRNYVWNRDLQPDALSQFTITHNINEAQLFNTREAAMKAMRKHLYSLCPKRLIKQEGIMIARETHLGIVFTEENQDVRLDVTLFDVTIVPKKIRKQKRISDSEESTLAREYYINELIKYSIYDESWLRKQTLNDLRWMKENYWKRHFIEEPKDPVFVIKEV